MKKIFSKLLNVITAAVLAISIPFNAYAASGEIRVDAQKSLHEELNSGYYQTVTVNADAVYQHGFADGKAGKPVTVNATEIITDPGEYGVWPDGTTDVKRYYGKELSKLTLSVTSSNIFQALQSWNVSSDSAGIIRFTAKWVHRDIIYKYDATGQVKEFTAPATGMYAMTCIGAGGTPTSVSGVRAGRGCKTFGKMHLEKGQKLYVFVGGRYAQAADIRLNASDENTRIMVAGAGGNPAPSGSGGDANGPTGGGSGGDANGLTGGTGNLYSDCTAWHGTPGVNTWGGINPGGYDWVASVAGGAQGNAVCPSTGLYHWKTGTPNPKYYYCFQSHNTWERGCVYVQSVAGGYKYNSDSWAGGALGEGESPFRASNCKGLSGYASQGGGSSYISGYSGCAEYSGWKFTETSMTGAANTSLASASIQLLSLD